MVVPTVMPVPETTSPGEMKPVTLVTTRCVAGDPADPVKLAPRDAVKDASVVGALLSPVAMSEAALE